MGARMDFSTEIWPHRLDPGHEEMDEMASLIQKRDKEISEYIDNLIILERQIDATEYLMRKWRQERSWRP